MKKIYNFLRSMRFGIFLLILVALCCVAGSLIPQEREAAWYVQQYGATHVTILALQLNNIYKSWYFILITALLCLNLTLCSVIRIRSVVKAAKGETQRAAGMRDTMLLSPDELDTLREHLLKKRCESEQIGEVTVYRKRGYGRYGSFLLHLSILLVVLFGALTLYTPKVTDMSCLPGESLHLEDGTEIAVKDFQIEDESGRIDYQSTVMVVLPGGKASGWQTVKVNYPLSCGRYKIYQNTYATAGSVTVTNLATGGQDDILLTELVMLSLDGMHGIWFEALYPDIIVEPDGTATLVTATAGRYPNPVYEILVADGAQFSPMFAFPGDEIEAGGLRFHFNEPVEYPGLRIKKVSVLAQDLLIAAFVLMTLALFITFFLPPVVVKVDGQGCAVGGPKPESMRMELEALFPDAPEAASEAAPEAASVKEQEKQEEERE